MSIRLIMFLLVSISSFDWIIVSKIVITLLGLILLSFLKYMNIPLVILPQRAAQYLFVLTLMEPSISVMISLGSSSAVISIDYFGCIVTPLFLAFFFFFFFFVPITIQLQTISDLVPDYFPFLFLFFFGSTCKRPCSSPSDILKKSFNFLNDFSLRSK